VALVALPVAAAGISVVLLIASFPNILTGIRRGPIKNPRPFPAVGFCRNSCSVSTSANGVAIYDDQRNNLSNFHNHQPGHYGKGAEGSSA
ncbi:MAG: hypothetical protein ACREXY_23815, partial [Gammaproteobacteria bacterium]